MHTNFNFSFYYPVMQPLPDRRNVRYSHLIDLLVTGTATRVHHVKDAALPSFTFEIEEVLAENENILPLLAEANGLEGIKAACMHHVKHISFGKRSDFRMSYLPMKKAV